jgi:hypothetical protein
VTSNTRKSTPAGHLIPTRALIVGSSPAARMSAAAAAEEIAAGLRDGGRADPDICPLEDIAGAGSVRDLLDELGLDSRMRGARAVVILDRRLAPHSLAGSAAFEIATRARQAGVPAYAVAGENRLDAFAARMLDLQLILRARSRIALRDAGRTLAGVL